MPTRPLLLALLLAPALAGAQVSVDLDRPGVLEAIATSNPGQYLKITNILQAAAVEPCTTLPKILKADFQVTDTKCSSYLLLASYPPKRTLSFELDNTRYISNVVLAHFKASIHPAVGSSPIKPLESSKPLK